MRVSLCVCARAYLFVCVRLFIYVCMCVCVCVCVCVCDSRTIISLLTLQLLNSFWSIFWSESQPSLRFCNGQIHFD